MHNAFTMTDAQATSYLAQSRVQTACALAEAGCSETHRISMAAATVACYGEYSRMSPDAIRCIESCAEAGYLTITQRGITLTAKGAAAVVSAPNCIHV